jgi:hypothetical protein
MATMPSPAFLHILDNDPKGALEPAMKSPGNDEQSAPLDVFDAKAESAEGETSEGKGEPPENTKPEEPPFVSQDLPDVTYGMTEDEPQLEDASGGQELTFGSDPDHPELQDASGDQEVTATLTGDSATGSSDEPDGGIFVTVDPGPDFGELQRADDEPVLNYPPDDDDEDEDDGED